MLSSPLNDLYYSFCSFVDHQICQRGQAYTNFSSQYYNINDPVFPNLSVYSAPFKQIIFDTSISGANIPTGLYVNGNFTNKGVSGLTIDYLNNRAILSGGHNGAVISGNYAVKSYNIYPTTKSDEELIYETAFELRPSFVKPLTGISPLSLTVPGIFIVNSNFSNETYSFGGLVESTMNIHCILLSDSKDQLDALGSLLVDEKYSSFPVFSSNFTPLNFYGDYKTGLGPYNYLNYVNQFSENLGYIADADFYKLSNRDFSNRYPDLRAAFCDFSIKYVRMPNNKVF